MALMSGGRKPSAARTKHVVQRVKAAYGQRPEMNVVKGDHMSHVTRTLSRAARNAANSSSTGTNRGIGKPLNRPGGDSAY